MVKSREAYMHCIKQSSSRDDIGKAGEAGLAKGQFMNKWNTQRSTTEEVPSEVSNDWRR
jgi:hypothetical protein